MKLFKSIKSFTQKWIQSWQTKPDFIISSKTLSGRQVSGKYSLLNALISGALGVRTLLSILVGIAGITSIVVYDMVVKTESPLFAVSSGVETENKDLLADLSYLLLSQTEAVIEPEDTNITVEPATENNAVTDETVLESGDDVPEISPETGDKDIMLLFFLLICSSFILLRGLGTRILIRAAGNAKKQCRPRGGAKP